MPRKARAKRRRKNAPHVEQLTPAQRSDLLVGPSGRSASRLWQSPEHRADAERRHCEWIAERRRETDRELRAARAQRHAGLPKPPLTDAELEDVAAEAADDT